MSPFNKCYVGNASHRRLHCVFHDQPIPKAVRATRPIIALIADSGEIRRSRSPSAAKHPIRTSNSDPLRASTVNRRRPGHRRGVVLRRQITVLSSKAAVAATSSQLHISSCVEQNYRSASTPSHCADRQHDGWENPSVVHSFATGIMSLQ